MRNTFSIITVVKNNAMGLKKTLHSIFTQEYDLHAIQSIVIDGASQDRVEEVCHLFPNIDTFISEEDKGIYDAMNKGILYARNDWVLFLNSGDIFVQDTILSTIDIYMRHNTTATIVCGHTLECFKNNKIVRKHKSLKSMPIHLPASHQSIMYKLAILKEYPFDIRYRVCSDLEQFARIMKNKPHIVIHHISEVFTEVNAEGYSSYNVKRALKERKMIQKKYFNTLISSLRMTCFIAMYYLKRIMKIVLPLSVIHTLQNRMYNGK